MSDTDRLPSQPFDMAAAMARYHEDRQRFEALAATTHPANKTALFMALAAAGITRATVTFDGYGDSGQIEDISAFAGDETVALPEGEISIARAGWGASEITEATMGIEEAIEQMSYDFLAETHPGWENNDGAYGEFIFDLATQAITLDHNERFTSSEAYSHEF